MNIIARYGREDLAVVYIAESESGKRIEFVESLQPPLPREEKWVSIVSTLYGCPVGCPFCDAGYYYQGKLSAGEILDQIEFLVATRYPHRAVTSGKWKIQFARMGDPALNEAVIDVLETLPDAFDAPGLLPSISTVAPRGADRFFERLLEVSRQRYPERFQFQFSLHSTDADWRRHLAPVKTWSFAEMAEYGRAMFPSGGRRVTLNFPLIRGVPLEAKALSKVFDPALFIVKLTPLNPTSRAIANGFTSYFESDAERNKTAESLRSEGYEVILSLGEIEENAIGSNCGQFVTALGRTAGEPALWNYAAAALRR